MQRRCNLTDFTINDDSYVRYKVPQFFCPDLQDYSIAGQFHDNNYIYIKLEVSICQNSIQHPTKKCKSPEDIEQFLKTAKFDFIFLNHNFDHTVLDAPIQPWVDTSASDYLINSLNKQVDIQIQRNEALLNNEIGVGSQENSFY